MKDTTRKVETLSGLALKDSEICYCARDGRLVQVEFVSNEKVIQCDIRAEVNNRPEGDINSAGRHA